MVSENKTPQEKHNLKVEILEQIAALATSGFGLVAALAWNEAIKAFFAKFFPQPGGNLLALFGYALFITIIVVIITVQLGRAVNLAKKQLKK
jgi:divalent metal cation (Fe/Co/Zn/Cd) transporter